MAPINLINTQAQKFWTEAIDKEETTRLSWHGKRSGDTSKSKQMEVFRKKIEMNAIHPNKELIAKLPVLNQDRHRKRSIRSINNEIDAAAANRAASSATYIVADMFPVSQPTRKLLFEGFTKEEKGRYQYLKRRHHVVPEVKYQFPLLSSWEYGWKLGDVIKKEDVKKPDFGRTCLVRDTFYTRNGIPQYPTTQLMKSYTTL